MAASATSLFYPLYLRPPRFSLLPPHPHPLYSLSSPLLKPLHPLSLLPTKHLSPLRASPSDESDPDPDTKFLADPYELFDYDSKYEDPPSPPPEGMYNPPAFDDAPPESEEDIAIAYEKLYGPAYSGESFLGNDMDGGVVRDEDSGGWEDEDGEDGDDDIGAKIQDGFEERVVQVRRVTKVVKGGKQLHFRVVVIVGDFRGHVGVGVGKAKDVISAVKKSAINARKNVIRIPLTKYSTFPHRYYCGYS